MKQILEVLKELLDEKILNTEQENNIRKILTDYKIKQQKIATQIDEILKTL